MNHLFLLKVHAAVTHFPVALLLTGAAFDLAGVLFHRRDWRAVSFWLLVAAVAGALGSLVSGLLLGANMFGSPLAGSPANFVQHRNLAIGTSLAAILLLVYRVRSGEASSRAAAPSPPRPAPFVGATIAFALIAIGGGLTGYLGGEMVLSSEQPDTPTSSGSAAPRAKTSAPAPDATLVARGEKAFLTYHCEGCHKMNGTGADAGPDLTHESRRHVDAAWQLAHLIAPDKMKPGSAMPAQSDLPPGDLKAMAAYLATRQ